MTPDVLINPNAFPSRMTIGMLIESMAGKAGALHGVKQDATPFQFDEKRRAVDHFGVQLLKAGYNYWGNETFYSGITGEEFKADIYFGVVYYQRLRHMVGDKYQVRSTGPRNRLTRQPIKGRKKGGGIRFGEMERDSLLGHGTAFLLHDRLMMSSDYHRAHVCAICGSLLSPTPRTDALSGKVSMECVYCKSSSTLSSSTSVFSSSSSSSSSSIKEIALPYVTRYLANELAAMNIRLTVDVASCQ
jgi:DNA-directed RNA polymerase I subunit RPA2